MINILIFTHKNLKQTQRLINRLIHPEVKIYVHVDLKCKENFELKNVTMIKNRFDVKWSDINQVDSVISALKEMDDYEHCIFLSGQDYPLKSIDYIVKYLNDNKDKNFIDYTKVSKNDWDIENRFTEYHTGNKYIDKVLRRLIKRKFPNNLEVYGGSNWWILTKDTIDYIINYYEKNNFSKKLKYTSCIDEVVFQTILLNSEFKDKVINDNKRYIDWSDHIKGLNDGNPNILTVSDYDNIIKSGKFFARKFDDSIDSDILDLLDKFGEK